MRGFRCLVCGEPLLYHRPYECSGCGIRYDGPPKLQSLNTEPLLLRLNTLYERIEGLETKLAEQEKRHQRDLERLKHDVEGTTRNRR